VKNLNSTLIIRAG